MTNHYCNLFFNSSCLAVNFYSLTPEINTLLQEINITCHSYLQMCTQQILCAGELLNPYICLDSFISATKDSSSEIFKLISNSSDPDFLSCVTEVAVKIANQYKSPAAPGTAITISCGFTDNNTKPYMIATAVLSCVAICTVCAFCCWSYRKDQKENSLYSSFDSNKGSCYA